jgi:putative membrane protein
MANTKATYLLLAITSLTGAAGCSSDEPSPQASYAQPAASQGDEMTPSEAPPAQTAQATPPTPLVTADSPAPVAPADVPAQPTETAQLNDAQIAKITDAVDTGEVEQAQLAATKTKNARVKKFANQMIAQHTQSKQKNAQLAKKANITPAESSVYSALATRSNQVVEGLKQADATSFDSLYISAQVQQHQAVLDVLNGQLIPAATNPELKAQLEKARAMVEKHLADAKDVQQSLTTSTAPR